MATIDTRPPCKQNGCRNRAAAAGYCDNHSSSSTKEKSERNKFYNEHRRDKNKVEVYNSYRWKKLSKHIRDIQPLCTRCQAMGKYTLSTLTDHLRGFKDKYDDNAWNEDVLYPLCRDCHIVVTKLERKYDFLSMPLEKAVLLKYQGAKIRLKKEVSL